MSFLENLSCYGSKSLSLEVISVPPTTGEVPKSLIVMLHGWGANAQDLAPLSSLLNLPDYQFLFPNAPFPHPYSSTGRAWYELREESGEGLPESRQMLLDWLQSLEKTTNVPLSRTILSGFSQGGAMTLDIGLTLPLAGLVSMSGYLHPNLNFVGKNSFPPTLIIHGTKDQIVPLAAAVKAKETLKSMGVALQYHEFDYCHEIQSPTIELFRNFAIQVIPN